MQDGDLGVYEREELIVILEGVLCDVYHTETTGKLWKRRGGSTHLDWHDVPLKRLIMVKKNYPHFELTIVTFVSQEVADHAAQFLVNAHIDYDTLSYVPMEDFVMTLRYRPRVRAVYDSEPERLDRYGQAGIAVVKGNDW